MKDEHPVVPDFFSRSSVFHALSRMATVSEGKSSHRVWVLSVCVGHITERSSSSAFYWHSKDKIVALHTAP